MIELLICLAVLLLSPTAISQQIDHSIPEHHPKLTTHSCTTKDGCTPHDTSITLDYYWRDVLDIRTGDSCITPGGQINKTICPTVEACSIRCAIGGADYESTGVETDGDSLTLHMFQQYEGETTVVSPQVYLLDSGGQDYQTLKFLGQEISYDVDVSNLPCGMNGAMYLTAMKASGGRSNLNPAGAAYGTGYCDSQCYRYAFINGLANVEDRGACCNEMDLMEANSRAIQTTPHPCRNVTGVYECEGSECDAPDAICDKTGCGFNPHGLGDHDFWGPGKTVDTTKPFRIVTQFLTSPSDSNELSEIRRLYIQGGKLIHNAAISFGRHPKINYKTFDSITEPYCHAFRAHSFNHHGGLHEIGQALERGMVPVMGLWDGDDYMRWLDSKYGGSNGPCGKNEGEPWRIKRKHPGTRITYMDIRWGDVGSTWSL